MNLRQWFLIGSVWLAAYGAASVRGPSVVGSDTYRRLKAGLDGVSAIDTHDHLWPFDKLPGLKETEGGRGMTLFGLWRSSYFPPGRGTDRPPARGVFRPLVGSRQT